jgi:hypothetical protein
VLEHALNNAAAKGVGRETVNLPDEGVGDESDVFCWDSLNGLLHNVVPVLILDALENVWLELLHKKSLLVGQDVLESLDMLASFYS